MLVEYEGTRYHGFQVQHGVSTVQGELENALGRVVGERLRIRGAGRTDAGVHAEGQVAAFDHQSGLKAADFVRAMNFYLPADIAIRAAEEAPEGFDPRRSASSREYRYTILNRSGRSAVCRGFSYLVQKVLDTGAMRDACRVLEGERDFSPFTNREGAAKNTVRRVLRAEVERHGEFVRFNVEANAFLPQQVRRIVGGLVKVGLGEMRAKEFEEMADSNEVGKAKWVVPAHGLCLMKVNYTEIGFGHENV